jgi:hypothetical protein
MVAQTAWLIGVKSSGWCFGYPSRAAGPCERRRASWAVEHLRPGIRVQFVEKRPCLASAECQTPASIPRRASAMSVIALCGLASDAFLHRDPSDRAHGRKAVR